MQDLYLINHEELDKTRTILNFEFEKLIQNDFNQNESVISFANWLEEYLKFVDEVKDGKTYIKEILEYDLFFDQVITKYPFCLNQNLFDPESMFSENELIIWKSTIKYFQDLKNQNDKLKKVSEDLVFDLYFNKLNRLELTSSELIDALNLKKQINKECLIPNELINHLSQLIENSSQSKFSNRVEIVEATENQLNDLCRDDFSNKTVSLENDDWSRYFVDKNAYDLFLICKNKINNRGKKSTKTGIISELNKYSNIIQYFFTKKLIHKGTNHQPLIEYLIITHQAVFPPETKKFINTYSDADRNLIIEIVEENLKKFKK